MELITRIELLAGRAGSAARDRDLAFPLACALGPTTARERALLAIAPWNPRTPMPPVRLVVQHAPYEIRRPRCWQYLAQHLGPIREGTGMLWLGRGQERGEFVGLVQIEGKLEPLTAIRLIGAGLERVAAVDFPDIRTPSPVELERWSRHIGALDQSTWRRQRTLRVVVVGIGRLGSTLATTLARWGSPLTLVDADLVELHNLDASDELIPADLGLPKAAALADRLLRFGSGAPVDAIVANVDSQEGCTALANAEVAVCCVDNAEARSFVGRWARRNGLVLLDVGTAVRRQGDMWRAGADVRLLFPGNGCLECCGGLGEEAHDRPPIMNWNQDRAGSLRTLNQIGAHLGLSLLEQLLSGRLGQSVWLRVEIEGSGIPTVHQIHPRVNMDCAGCQEAFHGAAEAGTLPGKGGAFERPGASILRTGQGGD